MPDCPLCQAPESSGFVQNYLSCAECGGIYLPGEHLPTPEKEKQRYLEHNNDVSDPRFRQFVSPLTKAVTTNHNPLERGLDFGAGVAPVITAMLREQGYAIEPYDPFFHPDHQLLASTYHYITCCEVIEHFHNPEAEFRRLHNLLKPAGILYIMTLLYDDSIDPAHWHYLRDPTHVFVYRKETIEWIANRFGYTRPEFYGRMMVLGKPA